MVFERPISLSLFAFTGTEDFEELSRRWEQEIAPVLPEDFRIATEDERADYVFAWCDIDLFNQRPDGIVLAAALIGEMGAPPSTAFVVPSREPAEADEYAFLIDALHERFMFTEPHSDPKLSALAFAYAAYTGVPYKDYLKSRRWRAKRGAAREAAGNRCQLCGAEDKQLHVHHNTYERRGHEEPQDLIVLCAGCHARFHNKLPRSEG